MIVEYGGGRCQIGPRSRDGLAAPGSRLAAGGAVGAWGSLALVVLLLAAGRRCQPDPELVDAAGR